jgi:hypothetical protein
MSVSIALASIVAVIFVVLGVGKILALPPMRKLAAKVGFSTAAYRRIGVLELAGAAGVAIGVVVPLLGGLAGAGLLVLLAGAVATHVRNGRGAHELAPAVVCALLVGSYLAVLFGVLP